MHQPALNDTELEIRNYLGQKHEEEKKSGLPGEGRLYDVRLHNIHLYICLLLLCSLPCPFLGVSHLIFIQINESRV